MVKTKIGKNTVYILTAIFLVAFLIAKQFNVVRQEKSSLNNDNLMKLSYEIIESANSIFDMQNELNGLKIKNDSFSFNLNDKTKIKEGIEKKNKNYRALNGFDEVSGRGIEIKVEGEMVTEELVDLINGIRNTKPLAISINNNRVIYRSYFIIKDKNIEFDDNKLGFPLTLQIIGDPDVLRKSLDRSGGILDILKKNSFDKIKFSVENKDNITIPLYSKNIGFKYAR